MKNKDYLEQIVVVYENTPTLEAGTVGRVLDFDSKSEKETSFLIVPLAKDKGPSAGFDRFEYSKWVSKSNIKEIVCFKRPRFFSVTIFGFRISL